MKYSEARIGQKVLAQRPLSTNWELVRIVGKSYSTIFGGVITIENEYGETYTYNRLRGYKSRQRQKPNYDIGKKVITSQTRNSQTFNLLGHEQQIYFG